MPQVADSLSSALKQQAGDWQVLTRPGYYDVKLLATSTDLDIKVRHVHTRDLWCTRRLSGAVCAHATDLLSHQQGPKHQGEEGACTGMPVVGLPSPPAAAS